MKKIMMAIMLTALMVFSIGAMAVPGKEKVKLGPCMKDCVQAFNPSLADSGADSFMITDMNQQNCVDYCKTNVELGDCYAWDDGCCSDIADDPDCVVEEPVLGEPGDFCTSGDQCISGSCARDNLCD